MRYFPSTILVSQIPILVVSRLVHFLRMVCVWFFQLVILQILTVHFDEEQRFIECSLIINIVSILFFRICLEHFFYFIASCSLIQFEPQLFFGCLLQICLFPSTHVSSKSTICGWQNLFKLIRQYVHLECIQPHIVHELTIRWFFWSCKYHLRLARLKILHLDLFRVLSKKFVLLNSLLVLDHTFDVVLFLHIWEPSPFFKFNFSWSPRLFAIDRAFSLRLNVSSTNKKIANDHVRFHKHVGLFFVFIST